MQSLQGHASNQDQTAILWYIWQEVSSSKYEKQQQQQQQLVQMFY